MTEKTKEEKEKETTTKGNEKPEKADKTIRIEHVFKVPEKVVKKAEALETPAKTPTEPPVKVETPAKTPTEPPVKPPVKPATPPAKPVDKVATLEGEKKVLEAKVLELEGNAKKTKATETELEKVKKDLKERTDVLALIALKEFETEKKALIDVVRKDYEKKGLDKAVIDEKIKYIDETIDDTEKLKQTQDIMKIFTAPIESGGAEVEEKETPAPAGRATMPTVPKQYEGMKNVIDELYNILADPTKTQVEKKEADKRLDSMFTEFIRGVRVSQQGGKFPTFRKTECPQCHELIDGAGATSCDHCGWTQIVPRRVRTR